MNVCPTREPNSFVNACPVRCWTKRIRVHWSRLKNWVHSDEENVVMFWSRDRVSFSRRNQIPRPEWTCVAGNKKRFLGFLFSHGVHLRLESCRSKC